METTKKMPSVGFALSVLSLIVAFMCVGMIVFKAKLNTVIFFSWLIAIPASMYLGFGYRELEEAAYDMTRKAMQPCIILLAVGAMIGTWILSGTVPLMIYIGLDIITPQFFLLTTLLLCSIVSLCTGTSWGTIGTAGLAMVGIGAGLDIPPGLTAGAVVSGAYFGDKMSPLSDSTNLSAAVSNAELMKHVKHMVYTTGPAYVVCAILFTVIGIKYGGQINPEGIQQIMKGLSTIFRLGFVPLIPAIIVIALLVMGKPPVSSIMIGALAGAVVAVLYQGASVQVALDALHSGYSGKSGTVFLDKLLNRGGMASMYSIAALFLFALGLGGLLQKSGILAAVLGIFSSRIANKKHLILSTMVVGYVSNCIGATLSFAVVMTGTLMSPLYKEMRVKPENLSRTIEDTCTMSAALIPWNTGAVYTHGAIGVSPFEFIPYCFLGYITPIFTVLYALTGFTITMEEDAPKEDAAKTELYGV